MSYRSMLLQSGAGAALMIYACMTSAARGHDPSVAVGADQLAIASSPSEWHYARGVACGTQHELAAARHEAEAISAIGASDAIAELGAGIPAGDVPAIARVVVEARVAQARGDLGTAIARFEQGIEIEDRLPYMEPPFWYYPLRQSLGAVLLLKGDAAKAEAVLRESVDRTPKNGWALFALREALAAQGDKAGAAAAERQLGAAWVGDHALLNLERL